MISVRNIGKMYRLFDQPKDRLKEQLFWRFGKRYSREFWALKDISFEIRKGETVGIIGRNGSGKSTLLQVICGTLSPTTGIVETNGRIAALLELGSGFNPEFTGHENVYMSAALLGLSRDEIDRRFDDIASFADIGEFIEQPVKTYSSGMFVRLAFAVNIVSDPEIMIVDEALAVGDMNFQAKCMTALTRIQENGATVLFVSHDVGVVKSLCSRGIYLEHGRVQAIGKAADVADLYIRKMREEMNAECRKFVRATPGLASGHTELSEKYVQTTDKCSTTLKRSDEFDKRAAAFRYGSGGAKITFVELLNMDDEPIQSVEFNQEVKIRIFCEVEEEMVLSINFQVLDNKRNNITSSGFIAANHELLLAKRGECYAVTYILRLPIMDGMYSIQTHIGKPIHRNQPPEYIDVVPNAIVFQVMRPETYQVWSAVHLFPHLKIERVENVNY